MGQVAAILDELHEAITTNVSPERAENLRWFGITESVLGEAEAKLSNPTRQQPNPRTQ